jgi:XTP/dITP diphosphohydrolase
VGRTPGKIVPARGPGTFGWDPIFEPSEGEGGLTYAEMTKEAKDALSHRGRAVAQLKEYLGSDPDAQRQLAVKKPRADNVE